jgi:hypothetical protein
MPQYSKQSIARLAYDQQKFSLLDSPQPLIVAHIGDLTVKARYVDGSEAPAIFTFARSGHVIDTVDINDLYNPNGWFTVAPGSKEFAITWSDGGAAGGFHTRIFRTDSRGAIEEETAPVQNVIRDFEAHHYCKTRGDNFLAVRWLTPHQLVLEASVYPTSDCGAELGYTDRYVLSVPDGRIERKVHVLE